MGNALGQPVPDNERLILEADRSQQTLGAFISRASVSGDIVFSSAVTKNVSVFTRLLSLKNGVAKVDREGFGVLHWAIFGSWDEGVRLAIEAGADVNQISLEGYSPLHVAAFVGHAPSAARLLDTGANIEQRTNRGASPVDLAAQMGAASREVLKLLIARNALVITRGFRNRNPLELALIAHDEGDTVRALLDAGADPASPNHAAHNMTPLHIAAYFLRQDAAAVLLEAGANPNACGSSGLTPVMQLFLPNKRLRSREAEAAKRNMFCLLRDAGADLNAIVPRKGVTVLHMAIAGSVEEASVALVLSSSVDPSIGVNRQFTNSKNSMLHLSARNGWGDTTHRLVAAGADVAQRNKEGFTPLHLAVIHSKPEAVAALLQAGADPNALAADVFPNVSQWRAQRGLRMAAVLMGGPDLRPSQVLAALMAMEPKSSAIDTAVMTIQNIKVVEALVASGAQPSEEALKVGATCTPILKDVVKRTAWSPELHRRLPPRFKVAARELMRCMGRRAVDAAGAPLLMPPNVIVEILTHAAYPLSAWADEEWLAAQQVRQPKEEDRHPAAGAGAGAPAVGVPAGLQGMLPGMLGGADGGGELGPLHAAAMPELMDNLVQHLMQEVAQELGHGNNNDEPNNNNNDQGQLNGGVNQGGAPAVGGDNNGPPGNGGGGGGGPLVLPLPMPPGMGGAGMGLVIVPHVPANLPFDPQAMADMLMGGPPLDFAHGMAQHHHNPQPMPHGAGLAAGEGGGPDEDGVDQEDEEEEEEEVHVVQFQLHFNVNDIFPNGPPPGFPGQGGGAAAPPGAAPAAADPAPQPAPEAVPEVTVQPIVPSPGDGASPSDAGDEAGPSSGTRSRRRTRSAAGGASGADANAGDEGGSGKEAKRARRR